MGISELPRKVIHRNRKNDNETFYIGDVIKEVVSDQLDTVQGDYRNVLQLIKRKDDGGYDIRLGYYVKDSGKPESEYHWGSQTTFQADMEIFNDLLKKAQENKIL